MVNPLILREQDMRCDHLECPVGPMPVLLSKATNPI